LLETIKELWNAVITIRIDPIYTSVVYNSWVLRSLVSVPMEEKCEAVNILWVKTILNGSRIKAEITSEPPRRLKREESFGVGDRTQALRACRARYASRAVHIYVLTPARK
jgi:hypothetical protein